MKIVFLDTDTLGQIEGIDQFNSLGEVYKYGATAYEQTLERINQAEVVLTNKVVIDEKIMALSPKLKYIGILATGTNNVDLVAADERGIKVQNVAGYSTESVAQHTFALLLSMLHQVNTFDTYSKTKYKDSPIFTNLQHEYTEIKGKTFGIIGLGTIGKRVAQIADVFGAKVVYYSTSGKNNHSSYEKLSLEELLTQADIVSIHAPLNEKTVDLIGEAELNRMKPNAILLNTGRGGIVMEDALANSLNNNDIAGACLDVFSHEPIKGNNPLLSIKEESKLLLTPHIAWASVEARNVLMNRTFDYLKHFLESE